MTNAAKRLEDSQGDTVGESYPKNFSDEGCHSDFCLVQMPKHGEMHTNSGKCYCTQMVVMRKIRRLEARVKRLEGAIGGLITHGDLCDDSECSAVLEAREALKGE